MTRLTVLYHDGTDEPVCVHDDHDVHDVGASHAATFGAVGLVPTGYIAYGPIATQCKALLERERKHWLEARKEPE